MSNKPFTLTAAQREEICQRYIAGESTIKLASTYGVTKANIRQLLRTRNIPRRANSPELHRLYQCDHTYFDQPLDEERAYWIGFLLADGFVTSEKLRGAPAIGMQLSIVDIAHVERFKSALRSNHPIGQYIAKDGYGTGKTAARFTIASRQLVDAVKKYGIVPRKTEICATPHLPPPLMRHMYRGYFDGDGGLTLQQRKGLIDAAAEVVGTEIFLSDFATWLQTNAGANPKKLVKARNTSKVLFLRYGGIRQVSDILHTLYDDATIYLERKLATTQCIWEAATKQQSHRRYDYPIEKHI